MSGNVSRLDICHHFRRSVVQSKFTITRTLVLRKIELIFRENLIRCLTIFNRTVAVKGEFIYIYLDKKYKKVRIITK